MKRRTFIKKSSIGLGAVVAGAGGAERLLKSERDKRRIYGIPDSVRTRTQEELDLTRYSLARADLPPQVWEQVLGLTLLAQDVFDRPEVAQAFGRNPQGYLQKAGLQGVVLDPQALEVKIALAVGDPEVHDAVARDDPAAFLQAIERKGLLQSAEPSQLAAKVADQYQASLATLDPRLSPEVCSTVVVVCIALAVLAVVATVAVAAVVGVYAYAVVNTGGRHHLKAGVWSPAQTPSLQMAAALGGRDFGDRVASAVIDDNVERIAAAVESLAIYRERGALPPDRLRGLVRAQMLQQLGGQAVAPPEAPVR